VANAYDHGGRSAGRLSSNLHNIIKNAKYSHYKSLNGTSVRTCAGLRALRAQEIPTRNCNRRREAWQPPGGLGTAHFIAPDRGAPNSRTRNTRRLLARERSAMTDGTTLWSWPSIVAGSAVISKRKVANVPSAPSPLTAGTRPRFRAHVSGPAASRGRHAAPSSFDARLRSCSFR
jgi:hypothetical protein